MPTPQELQQTISLIAETAHKVGVDDAYLVGGYPRSLAMGLPLSDVHDLDVASGRPGRAKELAGFVAEAGKANDYHQHHRTNTVTITIGNVEIDFQGSEVHDRVAPYVRLWGIEETPLSYNIFDRDFTMNSLAIKVGGTEIQDITGRGIADINAKKVVSIIPPDVSVEHDPLMITRAIRMACKYGFQIEPALWKAMKANARKLENSLSVERLAVEAFVLSKYPKAKEMIEALGITYLEGPKLIEQGRMEADE